MTCQVGATATDIFDGLPSTTADGGLGWETDIRGHSSDGGVFAITDITVADRLNIVLNGRYDGYEVAARDDGLFVFGSPHTTFSASQGKFSYSASATYHLPWGFMPYITYADSSALEIGQQPGPQPDPVRLVAVEVGPRRRRAEVPAPAQHPGGPPAVYKQDRTQPVLNGLSQPPRARASNMRSATSPPTTSVSPRRRFPVHRGDRAGPQYHLHPGLDGGGVRRQRLRRPSDLRLRLCRGGRATTTTP